MFFIFAWLKENQDGNSFEEQVPLLIWSSWMAIINFLTTIYISELKAVGFNVISFSREFQRLARGFPGLARFGKYEMFCFLRWQTLAEYLRVENTRGQVFQIDGDIVFNAKPEEVANDAKGLTFVLQGCQAFVSIANGDGWSTIGKNWLNSTRILKVTHP